MGKASLTIAITGTYNGKAIERAEKAIHDMAVKAARDSGGISQSITETGDSIAALGNDMIHTGDKIASFGTKLTKLTAPIAAVGAASVKLASDYQDAMAKVYTIMDKDQVSTEKMSQSILDLSTATGRSAVELADASYQALSASVETSKVGGFVEQAVKLSKAGFTSTTTAVDTLTTVINAYGMEAEDAQAISDKLVQTQNKGKTTVDELAQSIGNVIPTAAAYGVNLDNIATAYVVMTRQGINTANATTAINGMLTELADEGSTVNGILQDISGKTFKQFIDEGHSLGDVLQLLLDSVDGDSEAFANLWGNVRASKGALAIANAGSEEFNAELTDMAGCVGTVDKALEDLQTPSALANKAINALKNTGIELGEEILKQVVPTLQDLAKGAQDLYKWFGQLDDGTKQAIVKFGSLAVASGPLITVFGKLYGGVGKLVAGFGHGLQNIGAFTAAMKATEQQMISNGAATVSMGQKIKGASTSMGLAQKAGNLLKGSLISMGIAIAGLMIAKTIADFAAWQEKMAQAERASHSLTDAIAEYDVAFAAATGDVALMGESLDTVAKSAADCMKAQNELADSMKETWQETATDAALVQGYADTIAELADKGNLTKKEQVLLADAVQKFNEATGSSVTITDELNGVLNTSVDNIKAVTRAYQEEARAAAASQMMVDVQKRLIENSMALEKAKKDEAAAWQDYKTQLAQGVDSTIAYNATVKPAHDNVVNLTNAINEDYDALNQLQDVLVSGKGAFATMDDAIDSLGVSLSDFGDISDEQLKALRDGFDGSLQSIVEACADQGVQIPQALQDGIKSSSNLPEGQADKMLDRLVVALCDGDPVKAAELLGHDVDQGLANGVNDSISGVTDAANSLASSVIDAAKSLFESSSPSRVMERLGKDVDLGLSNGIKNNKGQASTAFVLVKNAVMAVANTVPGALRKTGASGGSQFAGGVSSKKGNASTAGKTIANSAKSGASTAEGALSSVGKSASGKFASGVGSVSAYGSGQKVANTAKSGAGSVSLWGTGKAMIQGMNQGMMAADVYNACVNVANRVKSSLKKIWGISSPSKVMAEYGVYLGQGLALGIEESTPTVMAASDRMAAAALPDPLTAAIPTYGQSTPYAANGAAYGQTQRAVPILKVDVTVNGAVSPQAAQQTGAELSDAIYKGWKRYERAIA